MKKFFMYVAGFMLLTAFPACSDDDAEQTNENPVSEEQQAIDDMVEALESQPDLSDFMNWLSVVDMSGVDGAQFTAFAPKNGTGNGTEFSRGCRKLYQRPTDRRHGAEKCERRKCICDT